MSPGRVPRFVRVRFSAQESCSLGAEGPFCAYRAPRPGSMAAMAHHGIAHSQLFKQVRITLHEVSSISLEGLLLPTDSPLHAASHQYVSQSSCRYRDPGWSHLCEVAGKPPMHAM